MRHARFVVLPLFALLTHCGGAEAPEPAAPPPPLAMPPAPPATAVAQAKPAPPASPKRPVVDEIQGVKVAEDYRWLEQSDAPEVKAWIDAQNRWARSHLDAVAGRDAIRKRVGDLLGSQSPDRFALVQRKGVLFALKDQPPKQQPFIVVMKSADDPASERVVVDPNALDTTGRTTIDFYEPSLDGKLVAVSLSKGGSESGDVHVFDVATGKETGDVVARVNGGTAGGSLSWTGDGKGFYYSRYPRQGERPAADLDFFQQVYFHKLGTPVDKDVYAIGKDFPRIAEVELETSDDGKFVLARVANGDGGEFSHHLLGPSGKWVTFTVFADGVVDAHFGRDGKIYLRSLKGSPRGKILRVDPAKPDLAKAEVVVPESDVVIQRYTATKSRLYVVDLVGGPSQIRVFDLKGKALAPVAVPPVSSVSQVVSGEGDDILYRSQSMTEPPAWQRYDAKSSKSAKTGLFSTSKASFEDAEVVRETCTSKDGTKIPLSILRKKGTKLDGTNPVLLSGYGGYSVSLSPRFNPTQRVWLDAGGVFAVANLRGGGEFGEAWHLAGNLTKKQNVFDDFLGCARHLVDTKVTTPARLAIVGGSNGGLLMGAALTQAPDMFKAVVSHVGIYDMIRVELTPNGQFNITEFGTVRNKDHFNAMYAYSPYHRVKDGTKYPAALFLTGANDPRVDPFHSRKMTARLQAATGSDAPILLRSSGETGHGMGTPLADEIEESTDVFGFLFTQLGMRI